MPEETSSGLAGRIKSMSVGALAVSAAVILVVGLVVGLAAGYKIEQQRVKNDNKKAESTSKGSGNGANGSTSPTNVRLIGKVGVTDPNSVTLTVEGAKTMRFLTTPTTIFVKASPGTASDITQGSRVVWKAKAGSLAEAEEVVVLPADAKLGSAVVSATPTSMTIKNNGKEVTVSTQGATVLKVTTAKRDDITTGGKLVAQTRRTNPSGLSATEVIVLPSSSKFVA